LITLLKRVRLVDENCRTGSSSRLAGSAALVSGRKKETAGAGAQTRSIQALKADHRHVDPYSEDS